MVTPASDGKYTVLNVDGPLSITVQGVQVIPGSHAIQLPGDGCGYRAEGSKTVKRDEDYTFTLTFVDGFKAGSDVKVVAQQILSQDLIDNGYTPEEIQLTGKDGTYAIPTVQKDYRIIVSGVEAVSGDVTATVSFTITEGHYQLHIDPKNDHLMLDRTFTVPYFDLSLYGLERYYYNPYCYVDENGNLRGIQQKGTPESAYDNITIMHAFIVAIELYYYGYDQDQVGQGLSYKANPAAFNKAISWSQGAGDISKRVGRVYGWDATTDAVDDRIFDDITTTFVANEENREFFMENNPWALEEMSRRLLEAADRGLWNPEDGMLEEIQDAYLELEGFLEEDMGDAAGEFQGSSIEVTPRDQMEVFRRNAQKLHAAKGKR